MSNSDKCRVCLLNGAKLPIFECVESKESVHSKLFLCLKEKIEDIEGYPRNICESCNDTLHIVCNFITTYKRSCELLESSLSIVKKEVCSDNDSDGNDVDYFKEEFMEVALCKKEPDPDYIETLDDALWNTPFAVNRQDKQDESLTQIKAKLKNLKEINFKRKCATKSNHKTGKVASSILEAEFEWNGERWCLKSNILKKTNERLEEKPKEQWKRVKLKLPKPITHPKEPPPSLCDICGEVFKTYTRMMWHKKDKHLITKVKCPECPQTSHLYSEYNLNRHMKRVHSVKTFVCDTCGTGFAWKGLLKSHIANVHLKHNKPVKKHACEKCSKRFFNAKSLVIHERSAHTGLRPAQCPECGACFYHEDYLKEHIRLHTGETPFKCPICDRGYAQRGNMRSHVSHNHRLEDLSPEQIKNLKPAWFKYLKKP